jgi:hypothetical protein
MNKILTETLVQLQVAKVQVHSHSIRKQINLFDIETGPEINFNGHKSILNYQTFLDTIYKDYKALVETQVNQGTEKPEEVQKSLDLARFEIKEFKNRFFPKDNELVLFNRIEFIKTPRTDLFNDINLKKKIMDFFNIQFQMIEMLDGLFIHRMQFLNKYFIPKAIPQHFPTPDFQVPTKKEISSYRLGQLSLFPRDTGFTNLKWNRDKIEFLELFICLHESNAIIGIDNKPVTKKDYIELLKWVFNIQIAHWHGSLSYGMDRKIKRESTFLKELVSTYDNLLRKRE